MTSQRENNIPIQGCDFIYFMDISNVDHVQGNYTKSALAFE